MMTRRLLTLLLCLVLLVSVFGFSGCAKKEQTLIKIRLSEVVRSIFYAPMYVALSKGFCRDAGLDVEVATAQGTDKATTALLSNAADIALIGPEGTIFTYVQGAQNSVRAFAQLTNKDGSFFLSRTKTDNFQWTDVKGKVILGGRPGGMPQMVQEWVLNQKGIVPQKDVQIIQNIAFNATAGAFKGGTADYIQLFEPTASMLEKEGAAYVVAAFGAEAGAMPYTVFAATDKYMTDNPKVIQAFTDAMLQGMVWVKEHTAEEVATAIQMFFPDTPLDILTSCVTRYSKLDAWAPNVILTKEAFSNVQDVMIAGGVLKEKVPYDKCATAEFAEKAVAKLKK